MTGDAPSRDQTGELIILDQPERQNLLGLMMHHLLAASLEPQANRDRLQRIKGDIQVSAGEMTVTLSFSEGRLTIISGSSERPRASVSGDMGAFVRFANGGGIIAPVLGGDLRIGGNPFMLLKLLPLIRRA